MSLRYPVETLTSVVRYRRDFFQTYLLVRAIAERTEPYQPTDTLAERFIGSLPVPTFAQPVPQPPTLGILLWPLSRISYEPASWLWLGVSLAFLGLSIHLIARGLGARLPVRGSLAIALVLVAWQAVNSELQTGQVMLLILVLLAGCWWANQSGHPGYAGALLGLSILVKPVLVPVAIIFVVGRGLSPLSRLVGIASAAATALSGLLITALVIGPAHLLDYLFVVLPAITADLLRFDGNVSLWTVGYRLFEGTGSKTFAGLIVPPLLASPVAAQIVSVGLPAAAILTALFVARRYDARTAFGCLVCASILASPIAWYHYLVLMLVPMAGVLATIGRRGFPRTETSATLLALAPLLIPQQALGRASCFLAGSACMDGIGTIPFLPSVLALVPTLGVAGFAVLLVWLAERQLQVRADLLDAQQTPL